MRETDRTLPADKSHARRRRRRVWVGGGGGLLVAAGLVAAASSPGPTAVADPTTRPSATTADPGPVVEGRPRGGRLGGLPLSDAERADALEFMRKHAPVRYKAMQAIARSADRARVEVFAARTIVPLRRLEASDPDLYRVAVRRVEIEDRIFDLSAQVRRSGGTVEATADLRKQLREQVAADVDVRLDEQRLRLDRLSQTVRRERERLDRDLARRNQLVDEQFDRTLTDEGQRPFPGGRVGRNRPATDDNGAVRP